MIPWVFLLLFHLLVIRFAPSEASTDTGSCNGEAFVEDHVDYSDTPLINTNFLQLDLGLGAKQTHFLVMPTLLELEGEDAEGEALDRIEDGGRRRRRRRRRRKNSSSRRRRRRRRKGGIKCGDNEHVVSHVCQACPAGTANTPGDDASSLNTMCDAIKCAKNDHVVSHACQACPAGTENEPGDDASAADTECDLPCTTSKDCAAGQRCSNHLCKEDYTPYRTESEFRCRAVETYSARSASGCARQCRRIGKGSFADGAYFSHCAAQSRCQCCNDQEPVFSNSGLNSFHFGAFGCGLYRKESCTKDDECPAGNYCSHNGYCKELCEKDEYVVRRYVKNQNCQKCAPGTWRKAGDRNDGPITRCEKIICGENEHVVDYACKACTAGTANTAGDVALFRDTTCQAVKCAKNEHVLSHACQACPAGTANTPGDDASSSNTTCEAIKCARNEHVVSHACQACPAGTENEPGDDASSSNTMCDAIKCAENEHVVSHVCQACPAGTANTPGDDASSLNTTCEAIKCAENEHVVSHACQTCPAGTTNAAGDDASRENTKCDTDCSSMGGTDCTSSLREWAGIGTCVHDVKTNGGSCKDYCTARGLFCIKAMDDEGTCSLKEAGHTRQTTEQNGCLQTWGTQICACSYTS